MSVSKYLGTYFISRNNIQDEDDDGGISLDEWKQIIDKDPSLEPINSINGNNPITGAGYKFPIKGGAKWKNNPEKTNIPFSWSHGKIICQAITEASFGKVKEIADQLNALCLKDDFD
jgi:hypothetical protein